MDYFSTALAHDIAGEYEPAVAAYEQAIFQPHAPVEAFVNLSFIYWELGSSTSLTFTSGVAMPPTLTQLHLPWDNCQRVLQAGFRHYPNDLELSFWARYYPYRGIYDDFSAADCQQLLVDCVDHNQTLMPYFFLSLFDEALYSKEVKEILADCAESPTTKNLWVASVLQSRIFMEGEAR